MACNDSLTDPLRRSIRLIRHTELSAAEPLWSHVPTSDNEGQRLSDFMMLIPKLRKQPQHHIKHVLNKYRKFLNVTNMLWCLLI